jgi:hypothetical protein
VLSGGSAIKMQGFAHLYLKLLKRSFAAEEAYARANSARFHIALAVKSPHTQANTRLR